MLPTLATVLGLSAVIAVARANGCAPRGALREVEALAKRRPSGDVGVATEHS